MTAQINSAAVPHYPGVLRLAEAGDWDQVAVMELDRREDLLACFDDTPPPVDTELDAQAIATLLMLNEELMARLKSARKSVLQQNKAFMKRR